MNRRFTVLVLALGFLTWIPETYAFGQKTEPVSPDKVNQNKNDHEKMANHDKMASDGTSHGKMSKKKQKQKGQTTNAK